MTRTLASLHTRLAIATVALALLMAPSTAHAAIMTFDQVDQGGTLVGPGGSGGFVGTNIVFEFVTYGAQGAYCGTPTFSGLFLTGTVQNCYLNFDTAADSFVLTAPTGLLGTDGVTPIAGTTGVLLGGTFSTFGIDGSGTIFSATGIDWKNQALLDYFGITGSTFTFTNTVFRQSNGSVTQADLTNTAIVPEPGLLAIFGLGLFVVGRQLARRRT